MLSLLALASVLHVAPQPPTDDLGPRPSKALPCGGFRNNTKLVNPPTLKSKNGVLTVTLTLTGDSAPEAEIMCWLYQYPAKNGPITLTTPPPLHLKQGDTLNVTLVNDLTQPGYPPPPLSISPAHG